MGRIDAVIPDELEKKLRIKAVQDFGGKKGSLTVALERAIILWVDTDSSKATVSKSSVKHS